MIVRVFYYNEEESGKYLFNVNDEENSDLNKSRSTITLPYAWVLKAENVTIGKKTIFGIPYGGKKIKNGDVIRLYDYKCRTIVNPQHIAFHKNEMSDSNAIRVGQEPEPIMNKIFSFYYDNLFMINPFSEPGLKDFYTFILNPHEMAGLVDKEAFIQ